MPLKGQNSAGPGVPGAGRWQLRVPAREAAAAQGGGPVAGGAWAAAGSTVSPYTAVSILSRPPPSITAAGARPGREPAQINSRASKGTGEAAQPQGTPGRGQGAEQGRNGPGKGVPGHPKCCLAWQVLGWWGRSPPRANSPPPSCSDYRVPQHPGSPLQVLTAQNRAAAAPRGDTDPRHFGSSTAPHSGYRGGTPARTPPLSPSWPWSHHHISLHILGGLCSPGTAIGEPGSLYPCHPVLLLAPTQSWGAGWAPQAPQFLTCTPSPVGTHTPMNTPSPTGTCSPVGTHSPDEHPQPHGHPPAR